MQLRPHVQNHELSAENQRRELKYNLDISLFERLCASGVRSTTEHNLEFPFAQLTVQRRMRPDIADLVRLPLYPELEDHPISSRLSSSSRNVPSPVLARSLSPRSRFW